MLPSDIMNLQSQKEYFSNELLKVSKLAGELKVKLKAEQDAHQLCRELLQEIEAQNQFCTICGDWDGHKDGCAMQTEIDKDVRLAD